MQQFNLWYAYFDSLFLKKNIVLAEDFMSMISKTFNSWDRSTKLNELVLCFQCLEEFILKQQNWGQSICTIEELNKVEYQLSFLLTILRVQKAYIRSFWSQPRRIQASLTHLYSIFQLFVRSFIPYQTMTIFQCKAAKKLCIKLENLQILANSIIKNINPISKYFQNGQFDEEFTIIKNFFQNFVTYIKNIPKIKKYKMFHIPELLKYIAIINPIEVCKVFIKTKLHKKYQIHSQRQNQEENQRKVKSLNKVRKIIDTLTDSINAKLMKKMLRNSCPKKFKIPKKQDIRKKSQSQISHFQFPTWIRRYSITHRKQSFRKISYDQGKRLGKGKSNTFNFYRSPQKLRSKTKQANSLKKKKQQTQPNTNLLVPPSPTVSMHRNSTRNSIAQNLSFSKMHTSAQEQQRYQIILSPLIQHLVKITQPTLPIVEHKLDLGTNSILGKKQGEGQEKVKKEINKLFEKERSLDSFDRLKAVDDEDYLLMPEEYLEYIENKHIIN